MTCSCCGKPQTPQERTAYGSACESCYVGKRPSFQAPLPRDLKLRMTTGRAHKKSPGC